MFQPPSGSIEHGVVDVLKQVSRRPIEPTLESDLVTDLGFDSLQVLELIAGNFLVGHDFKRQHVRVKRQRAIHVADGDADGVNARDELRTRCGGQ